MYEVSRQPELEEIDNTEYQPIIEEDGRELRHSNYPTTYDTVATDK